MFVSYYADVQGDPHKFKTFLPLIDYQLDDTLSTGKVSTVALFSLSADVILHQNEIIT